MTAKNKGKNKGKNMLNLGKELAQQSKAVLNLPKEKIEKIRQAQERDARKTKLLRSIFILNSNGNII